MTIFERCALRVSSRQIIALALTLAVLSLLTPLPIAAAVLRDTKTQIVIISKHGWSWFSKLLEGKSSQGQTTDDLKGVHPLPPESRTEKEARVAAILTNPATGVTLQSREPMIFSAIPIDSQGGAVQGLRADWESSNKQVIFIKRNGEAMAGKPGTAIVTAQAGTARQSVVVTVTEGTKGPFGGKKRQDSTRTPTSTVGTNAKSLTNRLIAQKTFAKRKRAHAGRLAPTKPAVVGFLASPMRDPSDDPLPDNETNSLYQSGNLIGTPPGKKKPGTVTAASALPTNENGNKNFSFGLPVVSVPGRGLDVSLSLMYNSLLWNKSTDPNTGYNWLTYDVDSGYPAQGFRLGYGQIEDQGSSGFTLTDPDGTRHQLVFTSANNYDSQDGTFIHFTGGSGWGTLYYADGTQVTYGAAGGGYRSYPTKITDRNGNYILISYLNTVGPRISSIQDTLGRYVRFYYDSNNDLVAIKKPSLSGQSDIQVMRFYYQTLSLTTANLFSSTVHIQSPTSARVIQYIYLPGSAEGSSSTDGDTGYKFDYSPYGMISKVTKFRGMTASTISDTSTGTVTEGTFAASTEYDYPASAASLSDTPTYLHRTDEWAGRTNGGSAPQYTFSISEGTNETISTVTAPDGTVTETHNIKNSGLWNDGLISEVRIQNATPVIFSKTVIDWEQNSTNGTPRIADIKVTNEAGSTKATVFTYDSTTPYNNIWKVSERDFTTDGSISSTELRRSETMYVTSSSYLNRHLLHLPSIVKVLSGSTVSSRVDYEYDNYGSSHANLTRRDDISMHDPAFDPSKNLKRPGTGYALSGATMK